MFFVGTHDALIIFPTDAIIFGLMFLGGAILRKMANDYVDVKFNVFIGTIGGAVAYLIVASFFERSLIPIKWAVIAGIVAWLGLGLLSGRFFWGESSGDGEYDCGGNYEE